MENNEAKIEFIARGVFFDQNKLLLCRTKGSAYSFLPGGHIEFGEYAKDALKREMIEETGEEISNLMLIGTHENIFTQNGRDRHEINFIYSAQLKNSEITAKEEHLEFHWLSVHDFDSERVLPEGMISSILQWLEDKKYFHSKQ